MITVTRTFTRPTTLVVWHMDALPTTDAFNLHFKETYTDTGKCMSRLHSISPNGLELTYTSVWVTQGDYDTYDVDSQLTPYWAERDVYCANQGIILGPITIS